MLVKKDAWRGFVFAVYALLTAAVALLVVFAYRFVDFYLKEEMGGYLLGNGTLALLGAGLCALSVWLLRRVGAARVERVLARAGWRLIAALTVVTLAMQVLVCYHAYFITRWDTQTVVDSAFFLARGERDYVDTAYFSRCPNNIMLMAIYSAILRAVMAVTHAEPSLERFMVLLILMQILINTGTGVMIFAAAKNLLRERAGTPWLGALAAWALYFILIGCSPWFLLPYSDSTALWIPMLTLLLYLRKRSRRSLTEGLIVGLLGGLAFTIKPQTMIPAIAILLCEGASMIRRKTWKRSLAYVGLLVAGMLAVAGPVKSAVVRSTALELNPESRLGVLHYFSMGLNEESDGQWDGHDMELLDIPTNAERDAYEWQVAMERIRAFGVSGLAGHAVRKCLANFSDGSFYWKGIRTYRRSAQERDPVLTPFIRSIVYDDGANYPILHTLQQGAWILVLMLCAAGALVRRRLTEEEDDGLRAMMLSVVGIICFNMLFEARARYIYDMVPVMIVLAVYTLSALAEKGASRGIRRGNGAKKRYAE